MRNYITALARQPMSALILVTWMAVVSALSSTEQLNPFITSVSPQYGSVKGGTQITISGINFASGSKGIFTDRAVFIGGNRCEINDYYTTDTTIVCLTPPCDAPDCLSTNIWAGGPTMELTVYVNSVEGILQAESVFTYYAYLTPNIYTIYTDTTWGSDVSYLWARPETSLVSDITIKVGEYNMNLGSNDEFNPDEIYKWDSLVHYQTPDDMETGNFNLTMTVTSDQSNGLVGNGLANTFSENRFKYYGDYYPFFYLYKSTSGGTVYSMKVLPSVRVISPNVGSLAGGTIVTIQGSGFSSNKSELVVYAGGRPCEVVKSDMTSIQCRTSYNPTDMNKADFLDENSTLIPGLLAPSSRSGGSPGWWVKMWSYVDAARGHVGKDEFARLKFGWRNNGFLSMYEYVSGYNWPYIVNYASEDANYMNFIAHLGSIFTAPYTGVYFLYMAADDVGVLGASRTGIQAQDEVIIASVPSYTDMGQYFVYDSQISDGIRLDKGDSLYLRAIYVSALYFYKSFECVVLP
jgi:hypothetical protein